MPLTSASTDAEVLAAFEDNALYDVNNSVSEAQSFIQACRFLLLRRPAEVRGGAGESVRLDMSFIQKQLEAALAWLDENEVPDSSVSTAGVRHFSFNNFGF